jgi:hypothetical protein
LLPTIAQIIEEVDARCMAADGPCSETKDEITGKELKRIYRMAVRHRKEREQETK